MSLLTGAFAKTVIRKAIEEKLPEWIGQLFVMVIGWIEISTASDIDRVAAEMTRVRAAQFRRVVAAVRGPELAGIQKETPTP